MAEHIYKCIKDCSYTMEKVCPRCNTATILPRPPKFSLQDKYASLRRESRKAELQLRNLY